MDINLDGQSAPAQQSGLAGQKEYIEEAKRLDEGQGDYSERDSIIEALYGKPNGVFDYDDDPLEFTHWL